jgi:DNA mismatch endonuclease (patch repair protein)
MDRLTKEKRSALMKSVGTKNTDIEKLLGDIVRPLWKKERYARNVRNLSGKPDIVFRKSKIVVFADGDFWHGREFDKWGKRIPDFWKRKIASNIVRDKRQVIDLRKQGYKVLRFWGSVIKKRPERVKRKIDSYFYPQKTRG